MRVEFNSFNAQRLHQVRARFAAQPSWALRAAAVSFAVIVLLPVVLLVVIAGVAAFSVLVVLGLLNRLAGVFAGRTGGLWTGRDGQGRRNVRVLTREG